ncbi:MAG TPA: ATP-binding cassette domain-containing protein [Kofleriaceae bacterium]|nr:ATP-binding cassette domain-containing protein [Kofleriaceae bacterium]
MSMIEARGLRRTFKTRTGPVEAVRGVDFHVEAGEIVGFLGPNGAGKSTTQRMLATLLEPTAGDATVAGCDLRKDPVGVRRRIGYVAQGGTTNPGALVNEELTTQARLYGITKADAFARARKLLGELDLAELGARKIGTLSGGQRRRLDIALGLVHTPKLVFLDEPSTGLDPHSRANLWDHIRGLRDREGATVFLTTHYLDEADALCDRILIIDHGSIVASGTPDELKRRISGDVVTLALDDRAEMARALLAAQPGVREAQLIERGVRVTVEHGDAQALALMRTLDDAGIPIASLSIARPSLDDVFLTMTGRSLRDADEGAQHPLHGVPS